MAQLSLLLWIRYNSAINLKIWLKRLSRVLKFANINVDHIYRHLLGDHIYTNMDQYSDIQHQVSLIIVAINIQKTITFVLFTRYNYFFVINMYW